MCTRYPIINRVSELKVHIKLTRFVQPEKIEIDANERAVNEKSPYCFFVCTTFDSFLNDFLNSPNLNWSKLLAKIFHNISIRIIETDVSYIEGQDNGERLATININHLNAVAIIYFKSNNILGIH